jgi:cytosine deaminase
MSLDLIVRNATLPDAAASISALPMAELSRSSHISEAIPPKRSMPKVLSPPFVDPQFHIDATLYLGIPRVHRSGALLDGIALWAS